MDSGQLIRESFSSCMPAETGLPKPFNLDNPSAVATWRFFKSWRDSGILGADEAVLFRQLVRWGLDGVYVPNIPAAFKQMLQRCSVNIDASGIVNAKSFMPKWLLNDALPEKGIDKAPSYRQDICSLNAEHYLGSLQQQRVNGDPEGFQFWKSFAQKEGAWITLIAEKGSTTLVVLPTGMGKSLCFQLLPIFSSGLTVVVVPTVALAMDQCMHADEVFAKRPDVNPQYFASVGADVDPKQVIDLINEGKTRLVFTSPEACVSGRLNNCLDSAARRGVFQNLVIDEAHVVSSWGMYFRVDFQLLSGLRKKWMIDTRGEMRTFLFTATITPDQKTEILKLFSDDDSKQNEFCFHSLRPEISYYDRRFQDQSEQRSALEDCLWHLPRPVILYSTEVEVAEDLYDFVKSLGFRRIGCFTGKTNDVDRRHLLDKWRLDEIDLMVATSAFGLGVDKADVRTVIHSCFPEDLNRYYQEVGRGGRDGYSSISVLIPTEKDIKVANGMKPKLLSLELVQERWQSMWEARAEVNIDEHRWKLPLNSLRPELLGDRTYQENIKWNKRLLLQLARAGQIEIQDLSFDVELSKELGEFKEFLSIRLLDGFNPDSPKMSESIKEQRIAEATSVGQGFDSLINYLSADRCISMIFKKIFGEDTYRCCGGCRWCRNEDRDPKIAPVFEYDFRFLSRQVRVVEGCEHPITGHERSFISTIRKFCESGIRRFACSSVAFVKILKLFRVALDNKDLFRLDAIEDGLELLQQDSLVIFHTELPTISSVRVCGANQVTHVLCGKVRFQDIRYLLERTVGNAEYFSHLSLLS